MSLHNTAPQSSTASTAKLGETLGYRFAGDSVELNATFESFSSASRQHAWALQLRAADAQGEHLVAEAPLPPLEELAGMREPFFVSAPARIPAGSGEYELSLVLVSKEQGQPDLRHDRVSFPRRERFCGPRFSGSVAHERSAGSVRIDIGAIENTRAIDNLSGTLSVELWALPMPYTGGDFNGSAMAGVVLGSLPGQQSWRQLSHQLPLTPPPAGLWHLTLMLREWTGAGYTTRDFYNFERPLLVEPNNPVIKAVEQPKPVAPAAQPAVPPVAALRPQPSATSTISVNRATAAELAKVKGLTKAVAAAIVAGRPYASLDQLAKIKGFGAKTLAKVRSSLSL